jgi:hypothetical protein
VLGTRPGIPRRGPDRSLSQTPPATPGAHRRTGTGYWVLGTGYWVLGTGYRGRPSIGAYVHCVRPSTKYQVPDTSHPRGLCADVLGQALGTRPRHASAPAFEPKTRNQEPRTRPRPSEPRPSTGAHEHTQGSETQKKRAAAGRTSEPGGPPWGSLTHPLFLSSIPLSR